MRVVGIDVGARRFHAVALDELGRVTDALTFLAADVGAVVGWAEGAAAIGVDSPDRWSTAPHVADASLSPKFRTARCGEIALGTAHGIWVPWTTPVTPSPNTWISTGIHLFAALRASGHDPLEVYPHGVFRVLNDGVRPPPKRTTEGRQARRGQGGMGRHGRPRPRRCHGRGPGGSPPRPGQGDAGHVRARRFGHLAAGRRSPPWAGVSGRCGRTRLRPVLTTTGRRRRRSGLLRHA